MIGSDALLELYTCPTEPHRWQSLLDWVCQKVEVRSAVVQRFRRSGGVMQQTWIARDSASRRDAQLHDALVNNASNPRLDLAFSDRFRCGSVITDSDMFPRGCARLDDLKRRLRSAGLGEAISVDAHREGAESIALILHRHADDTRPYRREDEHFLQELRPHIGKAADLSWRLASRAGELQQIEQVADRLKLGILVCGEARQLRWANDAADEILARSPHLSAANGILGGRSARQQRALQSLVGGRQTVVLGPGDENELHVSHVPLTGPGAGYALLLSEPRKTASPTPDDIAALLDLTPAEARVTAALCSGRTLKEYAAGRGISEGSARNQLKQVLSKTGVRRQAELVLHLYSSVLFQARSLPEVGTPC